MKEKEPVTRPEKKEHILVCLSSSPSNPKVIKTASKMAKVFEADFTALYIETSRSKYISHENKKRLAQNTKYAKNNGANIVTLNEDDIAYQVSQYAKAANVTKIVIGRSGYKANRFFTPPNFVDRIIEYSPEIEIYVIPDKVQKIYIGQKPVNEKFKIPRLSVKDTLKSLVILLLATLTGALFQKFNINESNIIMVYILAVMMIAYSTEGKVYSLISSVLAVLVFNFFFTKPHLSFLSTDSGYPFTFLIMFLVAFFISSVTKKVKEQAKQSFLKAYRTEVMLDMSRKLQQTQGKDEIIKATCEQLKKLLGCEVVMFDKNHKQQKDEYLCFPVKNAQTVFAVAGVSKKDLDEFEQSLLIAMLRESALTLEKEAATQAKNELLIKHKQEELRSTLLRAISHDLRTPLTGISGNAEILMKNEELLSKDKKHRIYTDIYDDAVWLLNLVENLLSITRFDKNEIFIKQESEFISDVIEEALSHLGRKKHDFIIKTDIEDESLSAKMDARLISQVIFNLIDNAMKYSPCRTMLKISAKVQGEKINICVADEGSGISDENKKKIFDMFYTAGSSIADSRRGLGLGLALCKAVVEAHGGEITVFDNKPKGTVFSFTLTGDFNE